MIIKNRIYDEEHLFLEKYFSLMEEFTQDKKIFNLCDRE